MESHYCKSDDPSRHASRNLPSAQPPTGSDQPESTHQTQIQGTWFRYCTHVTAAGRHCRMLAKIDSELCAQHYKARQKRLQKGSVTEEVASDQPLAHNPAVDNPMTDLLAYVSHFEDPASVHQFIGEVVKQFAAKQISRQDALAMGYLCQLLLTSFADHRKWRTHRR